MIRIAVYLGGLLMESKSLKANSSKAEAFAACVATGSKVTGHGFNRSLKIGPI